MKSFARSIFNIDYTIMMAYKVYNMKEAISIKNFFKYH